MVRLYLKEGLQVKARCRDTSRGRSKSGTRPTSMLLCPGPEDEYTLQAFPTSGHGE